MSNASKYKPVGWRNESHRHYLAAKGVKTRYDSNRYMATIFDKIQYVVKTKSPYGKNIFIKTGPYDKEEAEEIAKRKNLEGEESHVEEVRFNAEKKSNVRELRDELEVPGHVNMYVTRSKDDIIEETKKLMDGFEYDGYKTPNEIPEGPEKEKYRENLRALGLKVKF